MLRLGKMQECYDFVKWYATTGSRDDYDWGDMGQPFLDVKDADMLEPPDHWAEDDYPDLSHLVAIALLKVKLLLAVRAGPEGKKDMLRSSPTFKAKTQGESGPGTCTGENGVDQVVKILKSHVKLFYLVVNRANGGMWRALLSPGRHLDARPSFYTHGSMQEMQMALKQNYDAWNETPGAMGIIEAILHKRDF